jgi:hypothetical protein
MSNDGLAHTLQRFNRKERFLVVSNALGAASGKLCDAFKKQVGKKLAIEPLEDDWWAFDYHIDWLVAALHWHFDQSRLEFPNERELVLGQQEDFDLIVAAGNDIILIEAKGHSSWDARQLNSKLERLKKLTPELICDDGHVNRGDKTYKFHFLLMSSKPPRKWAPPANLPSWITDEANKPYHIDLSFVESEPKLRVERVLANSSFKVVEAK